MSFNIHTAPLLRLLVPYAFGIALGDHLGGFSPVLPWLLIAFSVILCFAAGRRFAYRYRYFFAFPVAVWALGLGYYKGVFHNESLGANHFSRGENRYFIGELTEPPSVSGARPRLCLRILSAGKSADTLQPLSGNISVILSDRPVHFPALRYGDRIAFPARPAPPVAPLNPHAFDYRRYLHHKNIHYQAFVNADSCVFLSSGGGSVLWRLAYEYRDRFLGLLQKHFIREEGRLDEYAVAAALLLGYREDLPETLEQAYIDTGSMHALAVSGAHVSMLFAGLMFLLGRLPLYGRKGRWVEILCGLSVIWAFTFLTGAGASVLRASVMFSIFLTGRAIFREADIWNILGGSALVLLLYNPYYLFDPGWQLSYAAVAGIVLFYPSLRGRLLRKMPPWTDKPMQAVLLGVSAQLGALPLSLFYFHQFPSYFWLAGWVVLLGGAVFLGSGGALVVLDIFWAKGATLLGTAMYWMVRLMNTLIEGIASWPGSVIEGIWLDYRDLALFFMLVLLSAAWLIQPKKLWFPYLLGFSLLGMTKSLVRQYRSSCQQKITVYHIYRHSLIDFTEGFRTISLRDSLPAGKERFAAESARIAAGVKEVSRVHFGKDTLTEGFRWQAPLCLWGDFKIALIRPDTKLDKQSIPVPVDIMILSGSPDGALEEYLRQFPAQTVVWDASNKKYLREKWRLWCQTKRLNFHDVAEGGYWERSVENR